MYATHAPLPGTQAPLPGGEAALVGLAALAVVVLPFLWPLAEHFNASGFGLCAAKLIETGHAVTVLWVAVMLLVLLLSGVSVATAHGAGAGDAVNLSKTTHIPGQIWALLWMAGTILAVAVGGKWLVLRS